MVDEEDVGAFAFAQKDRLMFRRGYTTQPANLDSGISHTVWYTKSGRKLATQLGLCSRSVLPDRAVSALTGKPLRLHRPSRVASCLSDFIYWTVWLIPESS